MRVLPSTKWTLKPAALLATVFLLVLANNVHEASAGLPTGQVVPSSPGAQKPLQYGRGGKISLPPSGDWQGGGMLADTRPPSALGPASVFGLPVFGTDVNVSGNTANEVVIAANPINPLNFVAGANLFGGSGVGRYATMDGGTTWQRSSFTGCCDPSAVFDATGAAYYAYLPTASDCPTSGALVRKSTDGGMNYGSAVRALAGDGTHFIDKEWIEADTRQGSPYRGRIYVAATSFRTPDGCANINDYIDNSIVLATSNDGGLTWSQQTTVSDASHNQNQFALPVAAPNGTVYLSYQYENCTTNCGGVPAYNMLTKSTDGGLSWSPSITVTGQPISYTGASISGYQYLYANSPTTAFRHNDQPVLGVSPTNSNQLYMLWTDGRFESTFTYQGVTGLHADILFSRSADGGQTWSTPHKINDDSVQGKDQFFPWMTVGSDGVIHASWMDRRDDVVNGYAYRVYYSQSTDGGLTWSANQPVADVGSTPGNFIGDYSGIAVNSDNSIVLPIWTDQRSSSQSAYTDKGALTSSGGTTTPTVTATATPNCSPASWSVVSSPNPGTANNYLQAISASSSNDVYAVGYYNSGAAAIQSLIERWDGASWSTVSHPITGTSSNQLYGVAAIAPDNVWAVGYYRNGTVDQTLTLHYDGTSWTIVPSPNTGTTNNHLVAVSGTSLSDVWAVGDYSGTSNTQPLTMHYDGTSWTLLPTPNIPNSTYVNLKGATSVAPNDAWAAGSYGRADTGGASTLILHWDGSTWAISPSVNASGNFNSLLAVDAIASNDIWAAGNTNPNPGGSGNQVRTLMEHWDGTSWTLASGPNPGTASNFINAVSATAANDVWVAGSYSSGTSRTLIEHWDGAQWSVSPSPNVDATFHSLYGVVGISANEAWAAGYYGTTGAYRTLTEHYLANPCATGTATATASSTATGISTAAASATGTAIATGTSSATPTSRATSTASASTTTAPTACLIEFQDVTSSNTFYPYVRCLACRNILGGYPCGGPGEPCGTSGDSYFRPGNEISRGQIAKIVANSAGLNDAAGTQIYEDVPEGSPFFVYIQRLSNRGYMGGYACGQLSSETCIAPGNRPYFRPSSNATRGQLSKIVSNAAGFTEDVIGQYYTDVPRSSPFYAFIQRLNAAGVMGGYPCGGGGEPCDAVGRPYFRPNANVTRGQASKIVANTFFPGCRTPARP